MRVFLIAAITLCGRISPAGMGSKFDRMRLEELRAKTDASLMGAETLRVDDAEMRGPGGRLDPQRLRAVITGSGRIPSSLRLFSSPPAPVIFTAVKAVAALENDLAGKTLVKGIAPGAHGLSVSDAIGHLAAMGARSVLIEGGGRLNYAALAEDVVDEIYLTITPLLSGDSAASCLVDGKRPLGDPFLALKLVTAETVPTGEVFLHYQKGA